MSDGPVLAKLSASQTALKGDLISYQLVDKQGRVSDGKGQFLCMEWIQMHRKYQVKSEKWCLFLSLAEVGS